MMLLMALIYASADAFKISVSAAFAIYFSPSCSTTIFTFPSASLPRDTELMLYSTSFTSMPVTSAIAEYKASIGPDPTALAFNTWSPLRTFTLADGNDVFDTTCRSSIS